MFLDTVRCSSCREQRSVPPAWVKSWVWLDPGGVEYIGFIDMLTASETPMWRLIPITAPAASLAAFQPQFQLRLRLQKCILPNMFLCCFCLFVACFCSSDYFALMRRIFAKISNTTVNYRIYPHSRCEVKSPLHRITVRFLPWLRVARSDDATWHKRCRIPPPVAQAGSEASSGRLGRWVINAALRRDPTALLRGSTWCEN